MTQKITKIILITIVICLLGAILWYGFNQLGNKKAINECRSYIGKNLKTTDGIYVKPLNFLCLLSKNSAQLVLPGETQYTVKNYDSSLVYFDLQSSLNIFLTKIQNKLIESPFNSTDAFDHFHVCFVITPALPENSYVFLNSSDTVTKLKDNYTEYNCIDNSYIFVPTKTGIDESKHSILGVLINNKDIQNINKDIYLQLYFFPSNMSMNATLLKQDLVRYNNINNVQYIIHNK